MKLRRGRTLIVASIVSTLLVATPVFAKCKIFEIEEELDSIPIVVFGTVTASSSVSEAEECQRLDQANSEKCRYSFSFDVADVLKGESPARSLHFEYKYFGGCPETTTFEKGWRGYLFLRQVESTGEATLFGASCGYAGTSEDGHNAKTLLKMLGRSKSSGKGTQ